MQEFVPEPPSFKIISLHLCDAVHTSDLQDKIKKGMDRDKPPIHAAKPFQERLESPVELAAPNKTFGEMRVHNASTAFSHQFVLIVLS